MTAGEVVSVGLDETFITDGKWWLGEHEHLVGWMGDWDWMRGRCKLPADERMN
jgi:hypothetical protein